MIFEEDEESVANVRKDSLNRLISVLMETDDETKIPRNRKSAMKNDGNGDIDDKE